MSQTGKPTRGVKATEKGQRLLEKHRRADSDSSEKLLSYEKVAAKAGCDTKTLRKFFKGEVVDTAKAYGICAALNVAIEEIVAPEDLNKTPVESKPEPHPCQELIRRCREMLALKTKSLITNPLTARQGVTHNIDDLYVDVTVVKRKRLTQQGADDSAQQGSLLYERKEISQIFKPGEFFDQVILPKLSLETKSQPIAIIGEPGAGKSSLLSKIASRIVSTESSVLKEEEPVVIWVSLAEVGNQPLSQYLLKDWLGDAAQELLAASEEWENALGELLKSGRVWLLLDAVDELGGDNPLRILAEQFQQGWMHQVQVVLTCRSNVWDSTFNVLADKVETYCTLPFSYKDEQGASGEEDDPSLDQVAQFISKWFHDSPENGEALRRSLNEAGKERLKDMVKNPLRLALLCNTWNLWQAQGGLPDTKAKLYKGFVDNYYDLQHKLIGSTRQRRQLNEALGELALWAIKQPTSRFRIRLEQIPAPITQTFGEADEEGSLLWLALESGWLNHVGVAAESPDEAAYAFFHPTFEEYFAACTIDNWRFFCESAPNSPDSQQARCRLFEPQWREVFLLWLGRTDVADSHKQLLFEYLYEIGSEELLDSIDILETCEALFLIAAGLAEFNNFERAEEVIDRIIELFRPQCFKETGLQKEMVVSSPVYYECQQALLQTKRQLAVTVICKYLRSLEEPTLNTCKFLILLLEEMGIGNPKVIDALTGLLRRTQDKNLALQIIRTLEPIYPGHSSVIRILTHLSHKSSVPQIQGLQAFGLQVIEALDLLFTPEA